MDHGHHDMPAMPHCSMNMLWNTQIQDTCIVFSSWHIHSTFQFIVSLITIALLGVGYEYLRILQRNLETHIATVLSKPRASRSPSREDVTLLGSKVASGVPVPPLYRLIRAILYGLSVFVSFFLMLVFMTYNAYLIVAVVVGAAIGHYAFNAELLLQSDSKGMACH